MASPPSLQSRRSTAGLTGGSAALAEDRAHEQDDEQDEPADPSVVEPNAARPLHPPHDGSTTTRAPQHPGGDPPPARPSGGVLSVALSSPRRLLDPGAATRFGLRICRGG